MAVPRIFFILLLTVYFQLGYGGEIRCESQNSDWCLITQKINLTENEQLTIENADHFAKVTHFTWRSASNLKSVPKVIFEKFPNMEICDLSFGIETIQPGPFEKADKVFTLVLIKNRIRFLPSGGFANLKKVQTLQLEYNHIERIEDYAFKGMDSLLTLGLNVNFVTIIGRLTFAGAPFLQQIDITYNEIETIELGAFDLPYLKVLNLASNSLKTIPIGLFDHAPLLTTVDINANNLNTVPEAFFGNNAIDNLDLAWNPLNDAKLSDFLNVKKLLTLSLQNTGLVWPTSTVNWDEPSDSLITELNVSFNKIANPDVLKMVSMFGKLEKLLLNSCQITNIKHLSDIKQRFPNMTEVHVDYNEMDCEWMKEALPLLETLEVELYTGEDDDDINEKKRERVDGRPCGEFIVGIA